MYVPNVLSASDVCCIQVFYVLEGCSESHGGAARAPWEGACGAPRVLWTGRALGWAFGSRFDFGSVPSVIDEIRFLENGNRSVPKNFRNRAFRFSVISVRFRF